MVLILARAALRTRVVGPGALAGVCCRALGAGAGAGAGAGGSGSGSGVGSAKSFLVEFGSS
jgi:hypothetical protein